MDIIILPAYNIEGINMNVQGYLRMDISPSIYDIDLGI